MGRTIASEPGEPNDHEERPRFVEYLDTEPAMPSDVEVSDNDFEVGPGMLARGFDGTAYALATVDSKTGVWYLMKDGSPGNPMRTRHTGSVRTWSTPDAVRRWLASLDPRTINEMMQRDLFIVPVRLAIVFDGSFEQIIIAKRTVPADEPGRPPTVEYELGTAPLPKRRRKPKARPNRHQD